jgi:hypothetical protein
MDAPAKQLYAPSAIEKIPQTVSAKEKCQSRVGRVLDDVWTAVTVIGPNSHQR